MNVIMRAATAADQPLIRQWARKYGLNPLGLAWPNFLVAERMDVVPPKVVGMGQLRPHRDGSLELASLAVAEDARGQGIGAKLVRALLRQAARSLFLMCREEKVSFYERFGFYRVWQAGEMPKSVRWMQHTATLIQRVVGVLGMRVPQVAILLHDGVGLGGSASDGSIDDSIE